MQKENNQLSIDQQLAILASAISDIGYWSWWTEKLPEIFQIEFGGTQLYFPPKKSDQAPESKIAIRFENPTSINFISKVKGDNFDWVALVHEDKMESPGCSHDEFSFGNTDLSKSLLQQIVDVKTIHGTPATTAEFLLEQFSLVFWCDDIGMAVACKDLNFLSHSGDISVDEIAMLNQNWWQYWRLYWNKINSVEPLPKDYACEVTIPINP